LPIVFHLIFDFLILAASFQLQIRGFIQMFHISQLITDQPQSSSIIVNHHRSLLIDHYVHILNQ
jgi:hypothetical protein